MSGHGEEISASFLGPFHDAELTSLVIDRSRQVLKLVFSRIDDTRGSFEFESIWMLRITEVRLQNVVYRIRSSSVPEARMDDVEDCVRWACTLDGKCAIEPEKIKDVVDQVNRGDLHLFWVESSWGAEIAVICKSVTARIEGA
jgi:hypothetical protein